MLILLGSALTFGFLHGLGADHLMAIAALAVSNGQGSSRRTFGVALRFAAGHALLLATGASAVVVLGWNIPVLFERVGEMAGGAVLIALGGAGLWVAFTRRIYAHSHVHGAHLHWHVHFGRQENHPRPFGHTQVPAIVGAVFAVSGLRALTMMMAVGEQSLVMLLPLIVIFAIGILLSMSLFGIVLARALGSAGTARIGRAAGVLTGAASIALGTYWILS